MRSDRRIDIKIDQAPPVSKEAGDSEQDVDHSNGVHRASRLAVLSALAHLSHHLPVATLESLSLWLRMLEQPREASGVGRRPGDRSGLSENHHHHPAAVFPSPGFF